MATATQNSASLKLEPENPKKTLTSNLPDLTDKSTTNNSSADALIDTNKEPTDDDSKAAETVQDATTTPLISSTEVTPSVNDVEKKVRRAERFGVPVQLSEQEKRNSRAERFGMGGGGGSEASKASEELKRKARAERFGLSVSADEEAKKKARLSRFGSDTKTDSTKTDSKKIDSTKTDSKKTDSLEEEKRKARALRFSQSSSNAVPHVNGKEDVGSNTAIEGNADEGA